MNAEDRLNEAEIKVAFLEQRVDELAAALAHATRGELALLERIDALERAVKVLAVRVPAPKDDVANAAEDPVPGSG